MKIVRLQVENFRGIKHADIAFNSHTVIVGDNNTGKSSLLEAIDLVLGPERLSRYPVIDEHDFYAGQYVGTHENPIAIKIEVHIIDLNDNQKDRFQYHIEWLNTKTNEIISGPPASKTDDETVVPILRVAFKGYYDPDEDDFAGETFFCMPKNEDDAYAEFRRADKRECGFLFLRTLRTGSRALSLEKGSLLDIILRLEELRPKMWEDVLTELRKVAVAEDPTLGISDILNEVQNAIRSFVPADWAENPRLRVSTLTRVELRKILTVFMSTGALTDDGKEYSAPFQHQGTGTINTLVLALLVMIADLKMNVIFAMEEPEIAIPPHAQKRIINNVISKSAQAIFTSHSPYVMEELNPNQILVVKREGGILTGVQADYPPTVKPKAYREEFKRRFCEALLARRVLIAEGRTEFDVFPVAARRLHDRKPKKYKTLEALGVAVINAQTDSQVEPLAKFFKNLGKTVYAVFDKQDQSIKSKIEAALDYSYECPEKGFEKLLLTQTEEKALRRFAKKIVDNDEWPSGLSVNAPTEITPLSDLKAALSKFLKTKKGDGAAADLIAICKTNEMPLFIRETLTAIKDSVEPKSGIENSPIS